MEDESHKRVGARIALARREAGYTQSELAELLGITTRSVQNYESGAIIPYRHLARIETLTQRRHGWLLSDDATGGGLEDSVAELLDAMERHTALLRERLDALRHTTGRLKEQRESRQRRTP